MVEQPARQLRSGTPALPSDGVELAAMEHRNELFDALMDGLPATEQKHVREAIASTTARKAQHIGAQTARRAEQEQRRSALRRAQRADTDPS